MQLTAKGCLEQLAGSRRLFIELFTHGTLMVEIYKPHKIDLQKPHTRDELYVVVAGTGKYHLNDQTMDFQPGDVLFAPAGAPHHFSGFTDDFSTWVIFYGPEGGELETGKHLLAK